MVEIRVLANAIRQWIRAEANLPGGGTRSRTSRSGVGAVVRFLHRVVLLEVDEDGGDDCGFFDAGHDPYRTDAVGAGAHVDADPLA